VGRIWGKEVKKKADSPNELESRVPDSHYEREENLARTPLEEGGKRENKNANELGKADSRSREGEWWLS